MRLRAVAPVQICTVPVAQPRGGATEGMDRSSAGGALPELTVRRAAQIPATVGGTPAGTPVVLETGYLARHSSESHIRTQVEIQPTHEL